MAGAGWPSESGRYGKASAWSWVIRLHLLGRLITRARRLWSLYSQHYYHLGATHCSGVRYWPQIQDEHKILENLSKKCLDDSRFQSLVDPVCHIETRSSQISHFLFWCLIHWTTVKQCVYSKSTSQMKYVERNMLKDKRFSSMKVSWSPHRWWVVWLVPTKEMVGRFL